MAKANKRGAQVQRKGRAVRTPSEGKRLTLGDLIAAAFDAIGPTDQVTQVLGSRNMTRATGCRLVFVS
jgi:hypothetical protein